MSDNFSSCSTVFLRIYNFVDKIIVNTISGYDIYTRSYI